MKSPNILCKERMDSDEIAFVKHCEKEPMSILALRKKYGINFKRNNINTMLLSLEKKGFLLFEEETKADSERVKYGLIGVREGSFADKWCRENNVSLTWLRTDMGALHESKGDYYKIGE